MRVNKARCILAALVENEYHLTLGDSEMTLISPTIEHECITLSQLGEREKAVVHAAELDDNEREALAAMGLHEEAIFELCQQGQPCIIQVEATRLGLSREVTERIMVRRCGVCN